LHSYPPLAGDDIALTSPEQSRDKLFTALHIILLDAADAQYMPIVRSCGATITRAYDLLDAKWASILQTIARAHMQLLGQQPVTLCLFFDDTQGAEPHVGLQHQLQQACRVDVKWLTSAQVARSIITLAPLVLSLEAPRSRQALGTQSQSQPQSQYLSLMRMSASQAMPEWGVQMEVPRSKKPRLEMKPLASPDVDAAAGPGPGAGAGAGATTALSLFNDDPVAVLAGSSGNGGSKLAPFAAQVQRLAAKKRGAQEVVVLDSDGEPGGKPEEMLPPPSKKKTRVVIANSSSVVASKPPPAAELTGKALGSAKSPSPARKEARPGPQPMKPAAAAAVTASSASPASSSSGPTQAASSSSAAPTAKAGNSKSACSAPAALPAPLPAALPARDEGGEDAWLNVHRGVGQLDLRAERQQATAAASAAASDQANHDGSQGDTEHSQPITEERALITRLVHSSTASSHSSEVRRTGSSSDSNGEATVTAGRRNVKRFVKNYIVKLNSAVVGGIIRLSDMDRVLPKESEREVQVGAAWCVPRGDGDDVVLVLLLLLVM
jgi:hypothetical protein